MLPRICTHVAESLNLGDEILAVNGEPLHGLTHSEAVAKLKGAGPVVVLRVRPNQTLGGEVDTSHLQVVPWWTQAVLTLYDLFSLVDIFSIENENSTGPTQKPHLSLPPSAEETKGEDLPRLPTADSHQSAKQTGPLPAGWGEKIDLKTGRPYFEKSDSYLTIIDQL